MMDQPDTNAAASMPPFSASFQAAAEGYGLVWLPDGFPGVCKEGVTSPHPILGAYVLADYLRQYARTHQQDLVEAIRRVASGALARMEERGEALVFNYPADPDSYSRSTHSHNSGLTQAYYALALLRASRVTHEPALEEAAHRCFRSLTVPVRAGGVLRGTPWGPAIEELPSEPPSLILNGWLSALVWLWRYSRAARSEEADDLLRSSFSAVMQMLPLYDAPTYLTSRYGLSGFTYMRMTFPAQSVTMIRRLSVRVPHFSSYDVTATSASSRWEPCLFAQDVQRSSEGYLPSGRSVRANLVFTRSSLTTGNTILMSVEASRDHRMRIDLHVGDYDPLLTSPARPRWFPIADVPILTGKSAVEVEVAPEHLDVIAYPTNCKKIIDGRRTNVYHGIHIDRLRTLGDALGNAEAVTWAERWSRYVDEWATQPIYNDCVASIPDPHRHEHSDATDDSPA